MSGASAFAGTLWLRAAPPRRLLAAHLDHVAGRFAAAGWTVCRGEAAAPRPGAALAVMGDPWCEPTPALAARLAGATDAGGGRWRAPLVYGLAGAQGWRPRVPPWTMSDYERRIHGAGPARLDVARGEPWTGFLVAAAGDAGALLAAGLPPSAGRVGVLRSVRLFRYDDPAGHERRELLELVPEGAGTVVDVGCGHGLLGRQLRRAGRTVIGIEPDPHLAEAAAGVLDEVLPLGAVEAIGELSGAVDCFVLADVLEHTDDAAAVLRAAAGRLAPSGRIVVSIPNAAFVPVLRALAAGRWDGALAGVQARDHLFFTTPSSFTALAAECGLEVERKRPLRAPLSGADRLRAAWLARRAGVRREVFSAPQWVFVLKRR